MLVSFRVDASASIGTGHAMRCLCLADELRGRGAEVHFVCRSLQGDLNAFIEGKGFPVHILSGPSADASADAAETAIALAEVLLAAQKLDWLILDHYGLDASWSRKLSASARRILVIDDLADRPHFCDCLLDQNLYLRQTGRYEGLLPPGCVEILGPQFALLRPEFREARKRRLPHTGIIRKVLLFFGGSDPSNETSKALQAMRMLDLPDLEVDVVVGSSNPHRHDVEARCAEMPNTAFHCQVSNMAELMAKADFSFGAAGSSTWERCCVGLPSAVVVLADNQELLAHDTHALGIVLNLGWVHALEPRDYVQAFRSLTPESIRKMSADGLSTTDGMGAVKVAELLSTQQPEQVRHAHK